MVARYDEKESAAIVDYLRRTGDPERGRCTIGTPDGDRVSVMDDTSILARINELVGEEHALRARVQRGELSPDEERSRLTEAEVELDRLWDLLRRRRAARANGNDPDAVEERPAAEVEGYIQ
jgi:hypothetical protein